MYSPNPIYKVTLGSVKQALAERISDTESISLASNRAERSSNRGFLRGAYLGFTQGLHVILKLTIMGAMNWVVKLANKADHISYCIFSSKFTASLAISLRSLLEETF